MPSAQSTAISKRVLRVRVKDKHAAWLASLAGEVNAVWNYCNELQGRVFERERKFLSGFDFWPYLKGSTRDDVCGDAALQLPVQAVQETAEQYAKSRRQRCKVKLNWRVSRGARRSLGWVPFKVKTIRYAHGQIYFAGRWLSVWDSWGLGDYELRAGCFSEDSRGRWYLNVCVEKALPDRRSVERISTAGIGIDLGLKDLAALSDGGKVENRKFYAGLETALASAQRANRKERTRAIHAKIVNRRKDYLHKLTTRIAREYAVVCVGDVNASALARGLHGKAVLDAGWSAMRTMLRYKCDDAAAWFVEVPEHGTTMTCSSCGAVAGPRGLQGLNTREWVCAVCGASHDRDINAARNILSRGLVLLHDQFSAAAEARAGETAVNEASAGVGHDPLVAGIRGRLALEDANGSPQSSIQ